MIPKDIFQSKLKKAGLLTGRLIDVEVSDALYQELKNENKGDFLLALKDIAYTGEIINLANIFKYLTKHKSERLEKENLLKKKQEEEEVKKFFKKEGIPQEVKNFFRNLRRV